MDEICISKKKIKSDCGVVDSKNVPRDHWEVAEKISRKRKKKSDKEVKEMSETKKYKVSDVGAKEIPQKKKHKRGDVGDKEIPRKKKHIGGDVEDKEILQKKKHKRDDVEDKEIPQKKKHKGGNVGDKEITQKKKHKGCDVRGKEIPRKEKRRVGFVGGEKTEKKKGLKDIDSITKEKKICEVACGKGILPNAENQVTYTTSEKEDWLETVVIQPHENEKAHSYVHEDEFISSSNTSHRKTVKGKTKKIKKPQYLNSDSELDVGLSTVELHSCDGGLSFRQSEVEHFKEMWDEYEYEMNELTNNSGSISYQTTEEGKPLGFNVGRDLSPGEFSSDSEQEMLSELAAREESHSCKVRSKEKGVSKSSSYGDGDDKFSAVSWENNSEKGSHKKILEVLELDMAMQCSTNKREDVIKNLPSFKETTEEDLRGIRMRNWISHSVKCRPLIGLDEEAPFKGDRSSLKSPKEHEDYWRLLYSKIAENDLTAEEIDEEVEMRLMNLVKKWDLVEEGILEKDDGPPEDFSDPYIPKIGHVQLLKKLDIKTKREINHLHESSWHASVVYGLGSQLNRCLKRKGLSWKTKDFSKREDEILAQNWERFQKEYKFYDLRPLIGMRTMMVRKEGGEYVFYRIQYLSLKKTLDFLMYMLEDLPERNILQVYSRLHRIGQYMKNGKFDPRNKVATASGRQLAMLENLVRRFGRNFVAIETVLGKRERRIYKDWVNQYLMYRKTKFFAGPWKKDEELRLLKGIYTCVQPNSVSELAKMPLPWKKIGEYVGTRSSKECCQVWVRRLGQLLTTKERSMYDKEKTEWPKLTDEDKLKLIELVYESEADVQSRVNWSRICRDHFPKFFPKYLARCFHNFYVSRVPNKKRYYFNDGIEYLYKYVRPLLQKKVERNNERLKDISKVIQNLPLPEEASQVLTDCYGDSCDVDEDEDVIDDPM